MARPDTGIDYKIIDTALFYGATLKQLQFLLKRTNQDIHIRTIQRAIERDKGKSFKEYREDNLEGMRFQLIQKAIQKALNGENVMLIFCLKNLCGWADKNEASISIDQGLPQPLIVEVDKKDLSQATKEINDEL